ncbi:MAG: hypothetical protein IIW03_02285 [Clostridia bacterium]|nr:hypothetical protein [Clostridia bacterium]
MQNSPPNGKKSKGVLTPKRRTKNLLLATDSAIARLEEMSRPGGDIENMDIKDLKSLISSIKDLAGVALELNGEKSAGGVVVLPEVTTND